MVCFKCGAQLPDGSQFCSVCGCALGAQGQQTVLSAETTAGQQFGDPLPLQDMIEYLRLLKELELSDYELSALQEELTEQYSFTSQLVWVPKIRKPIWLVFRIIGWSIFSALIGAVVGLAAGWILHFFVSFSSLQGVVCGAAAGAVIGALRRLYTGLRERKGEQDAYKEAVEENHGRSVMWQETSQSLDRAQKGRQEKKRLLNQMYGYGYLYPKYRGLVPVSTLYEYLASGRCFSLTGPGGAYNLYESELRTGVIINKLDDIIGQLDEIVSGQRMLADEIRESSKRIEGYLDAIEDNTSKILGYSAATASNTEQALFWQRNTAINTAASAWYDGRREMRDLKRE